MQRSFVRIFSFCVKKVGNNVEVHSRFHHTLSDHVSGLCCIRFCLIRHNPTNALSDTLDRVPEAYLTDPEICRDRT